MTNRMPRYGQAFLLPNGSIAPVWYDYLRTLDASSLTAEIERQVQANTAAIEALQKAGFGDYLPASAYVLGINSVETFGDLADGTRVMLRGDVALPEPTTYYGVNQDQERGFHPVSDSVEAVAGELTKGVGDDGVTTFGLEDVTPAVGGTLQRYGFDAKGRRTQEEAADTDDLTEGATNLYFTDERAQDAAGAVLDDTGDVELHYETSPARRIWAALSAAVQAALSAAVSALQPGDNVSELTNDAAYTPNALPLAGGTMSGPIVIPNNTVAFESTAGASIRTGTLGHAWIARAAVPAANMFATQRSDGSDGLIAGDLDLSWAGDSVSVAGSTATAKAISLSGPAGSIRDFAWQTGGVNRWIFRCTNTAEGGGNTGSNFRLGARADDGTALINVLDINRNEGHLLPGTDNSQNIGAASRRWAVIYAATGTINTSDERLKSNIRELSETELACASDLAALPKIYQFNDALAEKGHAARLHCSPTVQSVIAVMQAHGLDPFRYGFVCHDEWEERPESVDSETGEVVDEYRPAGDRYSLRPDELHFFIARGQEERLRRLEQLVGL